MTLMVHLDSLKLLTGEGHHRAPLLLTEAVVSDTMAPSLELLEDIQLRGRKPVVCSGGG